MISHGLWLLQQQGLNLSLTQGVEQELATVETDEVHLPGLAQLAQGCQGCATAGAIGLNSPSSLGSCSLRAWAMRWRSSTR